TRMTYPYDPPSLRRVRQNFSQAWFHKQGIPVTADRVQSNTYLSCMILGDALDEMLDAFVPDHLVERIETMLGTRLTTGYFPRLSLAPGQRFASKGGYLVDFDVHDSFRVAIDGEWLAP
ncbi:MAG: cytochrome c, partial [Gammaproteobacteria bacterium]|nr:cytochrome c [Gammaproteobacteria bacterium]